MFNINVDKNSMRNKKKLQNNKFFSIFVVANGENNTVFLQFTVTQRNGTTSIVSKTAWKGNTGIFTKNNIDQFL